jgi:ribosome modulation factor
LSWGDYRSPGDDRAPRRKVTPVSPGDEEQEAAGPWECPGDEIEKDSSMPTNDALDEGCDAYWVGVDVSDNPYDEDTEERQSWEKGWRAARKHDYDESEG